MNFINSALNCKKPFEIGNGYSAWVIDDGLHSGNSRKKCLLQRRRLTMLRIHSYVVSSLLDVMRNGIPEYCVNDASCFRFFPRYPELIEIF